MKTIVSRRLLTKLCYKIAALNDIFECEIEETKLSVDEHFLTISWRAIEQQKSGLLVTLPNKISISVEKTEIEGELKIDFRELCSIITSLPKEILLVEVELTKKGLSIEKV